MSEQHARILVVDDNRAIHDDFRKILVADGGAMGELDGLESLLFGNAASSLKAPTYELDSAYQGNEAIFMVRRALDEGRPYSLAFVDMRMPPGLDGLETIAELWALDPTLQVVICSAYSDYSWHEITERLQPSDSLLILKKPFDVIEAVQLASSLTRKWALHRESRRRMDDLETMVSKRTAELERANASLRQTIAERDRVEVELRLAQKLESVGRLASGLAHELNTPLQFANDSIHFVREGLPELIALVRHQQQLLAPLATHAELAPLANELKAAAEKAELAYLTAELPPALERALNGLERAGGLVRSLRNFARPETRHKSPADLNQAIAGTLAIAEREYQAVAELTTDYGALPPVACHLGEINQVVLDLVTNAADAVAERIAGTDQKGRIAVSTRVAENGGVVIAISDDGTGIPSSIRDKIFDPFFTTKPVGRGAGQGLAMARSIVVQKHGGSLDFETAEGRGTTFFIRLPADGAAP